MAIEWDKLQNAVGRLVDNAGKRSDDGLAAMLENCGSVMLTLLGKVV